MKSIRVLFVLTSIFCLLSCRSSKSPDEIKSVINELNESCPIDYMCYGEISHIECDVEGKTIKIEFKLNNEYMTVKGLDAFSEDAKVIAGVDIINHSQTSAYVDWAEEGYNVELSIYDDMSEEDMNSSLKWTYIYSPDYMNSIKENYDYQIGLFSTMGQLIAFNYANTVLSQELPKDTRGPWRIDRISTEYDYIDIYYKCTDAGANEPGYFNIFVVDGDDEQKMLGGGENVELTQMQMTSAFRNGKTVRVGGEPLFALDFLYKCELPARYHFEPLCTVIFRDK